MPDMSLYCAPAWSPPRDFTREDIMDPEAMAPLTAEQKATCFVSGHLPLATVQTLNGLDGTEVGVYETVLRHYEGHGLDHNTSALDIKIEIPPHPNKKASADKLVRAWKVKNGIGRRLWTWLRTHEVPRPEFDLAIYSLEEGIICGYTVNPDGEVTGNWGHAPEGKDNWPNGSGLRLPKTA